MNSEGSAFAENLLAMCPHRSTPSTQDWGLRRRAHRQCAGPDTKEMQSSASRCRTTSVSGGLRSVSATRCHETPLLRCEAAACV